MVANREGDSNSPYPVAAYSSTTGYVNVAGYVRRGGLVPVYLPIGSGPAICVGLDGHHGNTSPTNLLDSP